MLKLNKHNIKSGFYERAKVYGFRRLEV